MASLATRLQDLAVRLGTESKALRNIVNGNVADLSNLTTTNKTNLVAALNEIMTRIADVEAEAGAQIDDAAASGTTKTWSVTKIAASISSAAAATKAEILGGAGPAYDTLQELKTLLDETDTDLATFSTALANRVRTDVSNQGLNATQQSNARTNIGAQAAADIGNTDQNLVAVFEAALV